MKKTLALLLALMLCLSLMPTAAAIDRAVYADQIAAQAEAAPAQSTAPGSFMTAAPEEAGAGVSFNPYVFSVDENAAVSASVRLQPELMNTVSPSVTSETEVDTEPTLEAPTNFKVDMVSNSSNTITFTLGWDEQTGASNYEVSALLNATYPLDPYTDFTIGNQNSGAPPANMYLTENGRSTFNVTAMLSGDPSDKQIDSNGIALCVRPGDSVLFILETENGKQSQITFVVEDSPVTPVPLVTLDSVNYVDNSNVTAVFTTDSYYSGYYKYNVFAVTTNASAVYDASFKYTFGEGTYYYLGAIGYTSCVVANVTSDSGIVQVVTLSGPLSYPNKNWSPTPGTQVYFVVETMGPESSVFSGLKGPYTLVADPASLIPITNDNLTIALYPTNAIYTYNGSQIKPEVHVYETSSGLKLMQGKDFDISYGKNVNVADGGSVTVFGKGAYTGNYTLTFSILPAPFDNATMTIDPDRYDYTGENITPTVTVEYPGIGTLTHDTDYLLAFADNLNAGTASVTATGKGNFDGTLTGNFIIDLVLLNSSAIVVELENATAFYTGKEVQVGVVVTLVSSTGSRTLTEGEDYELIYENNTALGTATVTVRAIGGNLQGEVQKTFEIVVDEGPVKELEALIETLPAAENVTLEDASAIRKAQSLNETLMEEQAALLDPALAAKLEACAEALDAILNGTIYEILEGNGQIWNGTGNLVFHINATYAEFRGVGVNGTKLFRGENYTAENGSTIITLLEDYLKTLPNGAYVLTASFDGGYALANFEINVAQNPNPPQPVGPQPYIPWITPTPSKPTPAQDNPPVNPGGNDPKPYVNPFVDVGESDYFHDAVKWAVENGVTTGVDATHFSPSGLTSRGQMITFLWRAVGCPEPKSTVNPFIDVKPGDYFYKAVLWGYENGIVFGTTATTFNPSDPVTRAMTAAFLYRYVQYTGGGFVGMWAFPLNFADAADVPEYAYEAFCWLTMNGIITGTPDGRLLPNDPCIRAQIVSMLFRYFAA